MCSNACCIMTSTGSGIKAGWYQGNTLLAMDHNNKNSVAGMKTECKRLFHVLAGTQQYKPWEEIHCFCLISNHAEVGRYDISAMYQEHMCMKIKNKKKGK